MAGVKGKSGRKSKSDEAKRLAVIEKAWDLVSEVLDSEKLIRYAYAKDIVLKDIAQKTEHSVDSDLNGLLAKALKRLAENG